MTWNDIIGQDDVKQRLRALIESGRMPHAIMLAGKTGYGTLPLAMVTAAALICQHRHDGEACGECQQCHMLREWHHPDLHFSFPIIKGKSGTSKDAPVCDDYATPWNELLKEQGGYHSFEQWMKAMKVTTQQPAIFVSEADNIIRKLSLKSSQGGYKVAIIWLAERMNEESANKLLKTIEEPSQLTTFILVVEQPELLLETIRSRVQRIDVPKITPEQLQQALITRRGITEHDAHLISRAADGNWLTAADLLANDSEQMLFFDLFKQIMRFAYSRDVRSMKNWADTVAALGREREKRLLNYFMRMIRESFMSNFQKPELCYMTAQEEEFVSKFGRFVNEANVIDINQLLETALRDISQNTNQKAVLYDTALRLTVLLLRK